MKKLADEHKFYIDIHFVMTDTYRETYDALRMRDESWAGYDRKIIESIPRDPSDMRLNEMLDAI